MRDVLLLVGAGQIGMAIARRVGFDKKIIIGDKNLINAKKIADIMYNAGFDVNCLKIDLADRTSIKNFIKEQMTRCLKQYLQLRKMNIF